MSTTKTRLFPLTGVCVALALTCWIPFANAGFVDFETLPGPTSPTEGQGITTQYQSTQGMSFQLLFGGPPIVVASGNPSGNNWSFQSNYGNGQNVPAPAQSVGSFFLTDPATLTGSGYSPLVVTYNSPKLGVGGVILDIDASEAFSVTAYNASHVVVDSVALIAGGANTGDGVATPWSFLHGVADIASVEIALTSDNFVPSGFAFDNFTTAVPEPSAMWLLAVGSAILGAWQLKRRKSSLG